MSQVISLSKLYTAKSACKKEAFDFDFALITIRLVVIYLIKMVAIKELEFPNTVTLRVTVNEFVKSLTVLSLESNEERERGDI